MGEEDKKNSWFLWLMGISCFIVIFFTFYFFYFKRDYNFIIEVTCDPTKEICFERDCSEPDNCPPNQLSNFKRYNIKASDFKMCNNEDCANVCEKNTIKCEPIECAEDPEMGESCSVL